MKRFNYEAISLIPGLVKLIEQDNLNSSALDACASNIINGEGLRALKQALCYEI